MRAMMIALLLLGATAACADAPTEPPRQPEPPAPAPPESANESLAPTKPETWDFVLERSEPWQRADAGTLATMGYPPTEKEMPHFDRVYPDIVMGMAPSLELSRKVDESGSWFGIVRGSRPIPERDQTRLLLESKYFDGLTDTHILCLSFNGGGDFVVVLPGTKHDVGVLSVLRVYGTVTSVKDDVPRIRAAYAREFPLGQYCFMNLAGEPAGNQEWRELCTIPAEELEDEIYSPFPNEDYYANRIGRAPDFVSGELAAEVPVD